jgi:hypothetical protein
MIMKKSYFESFIYREVLTFVDRFMGLHFTATSALLAAKRM